MYNYGVGCDDNESPGARLSEDVAVVWIDSKLNEWSPTVVVLIFNQYIVVVCAFEKAMKERENGSKHHS